MIVIEYHHLVAFALALIVAFFSTPIARKIAVKAGVICVPKDSRRVNNKPMALMGGLAIIAGFLITIIYTFCQKDYKGFIEYLAKPESVGIIIGTFIIVCLGIVDDIKQLRARVKFPIQILAAFIVVATGTKIIAISKPFQGAVAVHPSMMFVLEDILSFIVSILWIVGITNAINLIDGLDGLAAGISGIAASVLYIVAVIRHQDDIAIVAVSLAGAVFGFLPYNFNPAKIFMGDTGSTFLGFILAIMSIEGTMKSVTGIALAIPIVVLGLPIFDTLFAIIRRSMNGKPIGEADRGHIHHRLIDMGISHKMSVAILYVISGALGIASLVLVDKGLLPSLIIMIIVVMFATFGTRNIRSMGDIPYPEKSAEECQAEITSPSHEIEADLDTAEIEAASGKKQDMAEEDMLDDRNKPEQ